MKPGNIVIFASGSGTNALNLIRHFKNSDKARVVAVFCNKPEAGVIAKAEGEQVPVVMFSREDLLHEGRLDRELQRFQPDVIALAGFMWLFPERLVRRYKNRIVNIHPALLPAYGGKGMYGDRVHRAVLANGEKKHGVTVHLVNEHYDEGAVILQESFPVTESDNLDSISRKIHEIEYRIYPRAIEQVLNGAD